MGMTMNGGRFTYERLHNAEAGTADGASVDCTAVGQGGFGVLCVQLSGISGETVTFEATVDGTNWIAVQATNLNDGVAATTATANGIYRVTILGLLKFRARISTGGAGTVTAWALAVA